MLNKKTIFLGLFLFIPVLIAGYCGKDLIQVIIQEVITNNVDFLIVVIAITLLFCLLLGARIEAHYKEVKIYCASGNIRIKLNALKE